MKKRISFFLLVNLLVLIWWPQLQAQNEWPQFRGPQSHGIAHGQDVYPSSFSKTKNLIWSVQVSEGVSSPVVWDDRIWTTGHRADTFEVCCFNRFSGELIWKYQIDADTVQRYHPISSAVAPTIATNGSQVIAYFGSYGLLAFDMEGKLLWERKLPLQGNMYGVSVSPVFINNQLIFSRDNDELSYLENIDPETGETIWRTDRPNYRGNWSTPGYYHHNGKTSILVYGVFSMKSYDLKTGEEEWILPKLTDEPATTPLSVDSMIYVTTYNMKTNPEVLGLPTYDSLLQLYDQNHNRTLSFEEIKSNKSILSRYDADGEGDHPLPGFFRWLDQNRDGEMTADEWKKIENWINSFDWRNALIALKPPVEKGGLPQIIWEYEYGVPECPSPIIVDSLIWMVKNGGIVTCLNRNTGEVFYQEKLEAGGPYYASPVMADGKIYFVSTRGVITVLNASSDFKVLAQSNLGERMMATPALAEGMVYFRSDEYLYAFAAEKD